MINFRQKKKRNKVTCKFSAVYLKFSDYNGRRKLKGFVWEKQLLPPNHAWMVFHTNICVNFENLPKLSWNICLGIMRLKFPFYSHALSARTDKNVSKKLTVFVFTESWSRDQLTQRPISMLIAVIFCAELTMTHKIFIVESSTRTQHLVFWPNSLILLKISGLKKTFNLQVIYVYLNMLNK